MNPDQFEAWREYLVGLMNERRGVAKQEAWKQVTRFLESLGPVRNSRPPSSRGLPARRSANRTRTANV